MARIPIEHIRDGMVLEEPVRDVCQRLILQRGSTLSTDTVKMLKMWGVPEVQVVSDDECAEAASDAGTIDPAIVAQGEEEVNALFRYTATRNPLVLELKKLAVLRKARKRTDGRPDDPNTE
ncbi:MAG TPA: hypothetical protein VMM37_05660 [Bacteroidota bacterium]|nr:hypothetical protein [Bacteroidota bacterium]